jgi:hypothetical protein
VTECAASDADRHKSVVRNRRPSQNCRLKPAAGSSIIGHGERVVPIFIDRERAILMASSPPSIAGPYPE